MRLTAVAISIGALLMGCDSKALSPGEDAGDGPDLAAASVDLASAAHDLAGAQRDLVTGSPDLTHANSDLASGPVDLAGATCSSVAAAEQQFLDTHRACQRDSDCARVGSACGLPAQCGAYIQTSAVGGMTPFDNAWKMLGCPMPCPPCVAPQPAACINGTCAALPFTDRSVGATCDGDYQCHTEGQYMGSCLPPPQFAGGYCSLPCAHGYGCPRAGMTCRSQPPGTTPWQCFVDCSTDGDCRGAEGYKCCPPWGPNQSAQHVCYPGPCPS